MLEPETRAAAERDLQHPFLVFLNLKFAERVRPVSGAVASVAEDTSAIRGGEPTGAYTHPDALFVQAWRPAVLPCVRLETHSFELKRFGAASSLSVQQAYAHGRLVDFAHLATPADFDDLSPLLDVIGQCERLGVGLIAFEDHQNPSRFRQLVHPTCNAMSPTVADGFLASRLSPSSIDKLHRFYEQGPAS